MKPATGKRFAPIAVLVAALSGCGGAGAAAGAFTSSPVAYSRSVDAGPALKIAIKNFHFDPDMLAVKSGQKVTVTNQDTTVHTITADDKSFDSGNLKKGQSYTFTPKPGAHTYVCDIHQYMTGKITVS